MVEILLIEDSESLRKVLAEKLRAEKFKVIEAPNGVEALKLIAGGQKPDLIIADIIMFPIDGIEMTRHIRQMGAWGRDVSVIALTNSRDAGPQVAELGLAAYLIKAETSLDDVVSKAKELLREHKKLKSSWNNIKKK